MFTRKFFQEAGRRGGNATKKKHGKKHYETIGSIKPKKALSTDSPEEH